MTSALDQFIRQRLEDMLTQPGMWGSLEAIELQAITLLEVREALIRPGHPRAVLDRYCAVLARRLGRGNSPLYVLVPASEAFLQELRAISAEMLAV